MANTSTDYIDAEHTGDDREMLEIFYEACLSEGGTADEIHLRGLRAVIAADRARAEGPPAVTTSALLEAALATTSEQIPPGPYSEHELRTQWNAQADEFNQWESLDLSEQLAWAQARAIAADRARWGRPAKQ